MLVSDAAKKLGMNTQSLRLALRQRRFSMFGEAVKTSKDRWVYYINDKRLEDYLNGRDYEKLVNKCDDDSNILNGYQSTETRTH